ncbi:lytic transglycosylase domain-containing protein [Niallia sp. 03133]|uniref:lytic transglycosylase domain-containing protein n=1 Tax=Niallia sp. 03133 TaxID=3458060 RepID=UPI0040443B3C
MVNKLSVVSILTMILLFLGQEKIDAASLSELEQTKQQIEEERYNIKMELKRKNTPELVMKNSKLVAKENAYKMAIKYLEDDVKRTESESSVIRRVSINPGEIPEPYIPIYQVAAGRYGVDWTVLAAIHQIETRFSTIKTMISSVGAIGHMQFMPVTFAAYGVDGNGDGKISPWNMEDAIYSAANYLAANNFSHDIRKAIWHYNHAEWYVNEVLATAASFSIKNN